MHGLDPGNCGRQKFGNGACLFGCAPFVVHQRIFQQGRQSLRIVPPPRRNMAHRRHGRGGDGRKQHDANGASGNDLCDWAPHGQSVCHAFFGADAIKANLTGPLTQVARP